MSKEQKVKLTIPTEIEVDASRLEGPVEGIRFEITKESLDEFRSILAPEVKRRVDEGSRIFITESDNFLVLNPEE